MVVRNRAEDLAIVLHDHREESRARASMLQVQQDALASWSAEHSAHVPDFGVLAVAEPSVGAEALPAGGLAGMQVELIEWVPPAKLVAERALSGWRRTENSSYAKDLRAAWGDLHEPIAAARLRSLPKPKYRTPRVCFWAGRCLCNERGALIRLCVSKWASALKAMLQKDSVLRPFYDKGVALIRLGRSDRDSETSQKALWFHLSFGNLNVFRFTLTVLAPAPPGSPQASFAARRGMVALVAPSPTQRLNLWGAADLFGFDRTWQMEAYRLYLGDEQVWGAFIPCEQLMAVKIPEAGCTTVWSPSAWRRPRAGAQAPPAPVAGGGDRPGPLPLEDMMALDDPNGNNVDPDSMPGDLAEALADADVAFDLAEIIENDSATWDVPDVAHDFEEDLFGSDYEEAGAQVGPPPREPPASASSSSAPAVVEGRAPLPEAAPVHNAIDEPLPAPPPPAAAVHGRRGGGARLQHHPEYAADIRGDGHGVLKLDSQRRILSAHCRHPAHGPLCRVNRTLNARVQNPAAGRPGGFLLAWLAIADQYPDRIAHHDASTPRYSIITRGLDYEHRRAARAWAQQHAPEVHQLLQAEEAPRGIGQGDEPGELC